VLNCNIAARKQSRLFKLFMGSAIFILSLICLVILINIDEVNASDPNLLTEIDLVNGGFRELRWDTHISDCNDMVYETHKQTSGGNVKIYKKTMKVLSWIIRSA